MQQQKLVLEKLQFALTLTAIMPIKPKKAVTIPINTVTVEITGARTLAMYRNLDTAT